MNINAILIFFIVLAGILFSSKDNQRSRGFFVILCSLLLIIVASLRSPDWFADRYGLDTLSYKYDFENLSNTEWSMVWQTIVRYYQGYGDDYDVGFIVMKKIISFFTDSFYVYSIIANLLFFVPLGIVLYRYSTSVINIVFAYIFYIALIQIFLLAGTRQVFAIGFDIMAFLAVVDRKKWKAMIFFLLGISVHLSSSIFIIPLLMIWYDVQPRSLKLIHAICLIVFPIILLSPDTIIVFLGAASGSERYANYSTGETGAGASTFTNLIAALSLLCLLAIRRVDLRDKPYIRIFYVMVPLFTFFAPLIRGNGVMIRISLYFHLYLMLLVPYAIECISKDTAKSFLKCVAIAGLAYMNLKGGGIDYYFFWQR